MERRVVIPRPKGTRASSRAKLTIHAHPKWLRAIEARADARGMSLSGYVLALFDTDADDDDVAALGGHAVEAGRATAAAARSVLAAPRSMVRKHLEETAGADGGADASDAFWARRALGAREEG